MTATNRNPSNPNFLQQNKFILNFGRAPSIQFFCQSVSVPGISLSEVPQFTPFVDVYVPGEKAIYDVLNVTFIVDEELKGWLEIHDWIRAMTFPKEFTEYQNLGRLSRIASATKTASDKPQYSDASITILSSSNKPYFKFKYYDCFPTSLSTFIMGANDSPESTMSADATFRYSYFDVEKLI
jgi:hypothetical protein